MLTIEAFKNKFFDTDRRAQSPEKAEKDVAATKLARRRRYSHTFSAGRRAKLVTNKAGRAKWRRVPDGALVHYGKTNSHRNTAQKRAHYRKLAPRVR